MIIPNVVILLSLILSNIISFRSWLLMSLDTATIGSSSNDPPLTRYIRFIPLSESVFHMAHVEH